MLVLTQQLTPGIPGTPSHSQPGYLVAGDDVPSSNILFDSVDPSTLSKSIFEQGTSSPARYLLAPSDCLLYTAVILELSVR